MTFPAVIRGRVTPSFHGTWNAIQPAVVTKSGLIYTFSLDYSTLLVTATPALADYEVILRNVANNTLSRVSLANLPTGATDWADVQNTPTTLAGYGITDAIPNTRAILTTAPITGGGGLSGDLTLAHATSGATAGSYTNASLTVDGFGHVTAVSSGAGTALPSGYIAGLGLANNVTDATNDIDIAAGRCRDSTNAVDIVLASALTKRLDAAWAVGTGNGGRMSAAAIADGTYHLFAIRRSDTGVVDSGFDVSATAPTMPTNYDSFRRLGSVIRSGSAILAFVQDGDLFSLTNTVLDVSGATNFGTTAQTATITVPAGVRVQAQLRLGMIWTHASLAASLVVSDLATTDETPSTNNGQVTVPGMNVAMANTGQAFIMTNTSKQVRYRVSQNSANMFVNIRTTGWIDARGKA